MVAELIYGAGLRSNEALRLGVLDIDFGMNTIIVLNGKGGKDRVTPSTKRRNPQVKTTNTFSNTTSP